MIDRSYQVGKEQIAYVGGALAKVKDRYVKRVTRAGALHAQTDFSMFYPPLGPTVSVRSTEPVSVVGTTVRDGVEYRLVAFSQVPGVKLLINEDGSFEGSGLGIGNARMGYTYKPQPPHVWLRPDSSTSVVGESPGSINYEVIYTGVTKDSIRLLYREYTAGDMARPAFSQEAVYERDSTSIRFRNILLRVLQANGEQIRYIVIEDGYPPSK